MLGLGIGATTAIFSIVEGVLLRPLPFPHSEKLVVLTDILEGANWEGVARPGSRHPTSARTREIPTASKILAGVGSKVTNCRALESRRR
jgi:hypothetical protein